MRPARSVRAEQARLSHAMRSDGFSWRQIADEFVRRWGCTYLQAFRLAHGLSQEQAAVRFNSTWQPERPLTGKHISYWEAWPARSGKEPPLRKLDMLAAVYECSVSDLLAGVGDYRKLDGIREGPRPLPDDEPRDFRIRSATSEDFSSWQAAMGGFRSADLLVGGGYLYPSVVSYLQAEVAPGLVGGDSASDEGPVFTAAAALTEMAGWMAHDAGRDPPGSTSAVPSHSPSQGMTVSSTRMYWAA